MNRERDRRYESHSNVLCAARQNPFEKFIRWFSSTLVASAQPTGGMTDAYRGSRLRRRIRYIIRPRDTKTRGFCVTILYIRYRYHSDFMHGGIVDDAHLSVTRERERRTIRNLRYLKCLLDVHDDARRVRTKRISNSTR